jgi:PPOX class probable F420-dependent enzyme
VTRNCGDPELERIMRMTQESSRRLFGQARVARLATVSPTGEPHLVPVTFAVITPAVITPAASDLETQEQGPVADTMIVFAVDHKPKSTTALRRLANIAANPRVAFLVDSYTEDWEQLWWVRADATAAVLHGDQRQHALTALTAKYVHYERTPPDGVVVGADVARWTGWQSAAAEPGMRHRR